MLIEVTGSKFVENLRFLRKRYALSRRALAKLTGMCEYTLRDIENEIRCPIFTRRQIIRLCAVFDVELEDMTTRSFSGDG